MTQRHHINTEEIIDLIQLLKTINSRTNQTEIKEQIIVEIVQNKSQYSFKTPDDYSTSTDHAFDKVLETVYGQTEQQISRAREEMQQELAQIKETTAEKIEETSTIRAAEREKTIVTLSKKKAADAVRAFRKVRNIEWLFYVIAGIVYALTTQTIKQLPHTGSKYSVLGIRRQSRFPKEGHLPTNKKAF